MKSKQHLVKICLVGAALWQALTCGAQNNLVVNGGFETGDFTGWQTGEGTTTGGSFPITFRVSQSMDYDTKFTAPFTVHSGLYCALVSVPGGYNSEDQLSYSYCYLSQNLPTQAGATYQVSFWIDPIEDSSCQVFWSGSPGAPIYSESSAQSEWLNVQETVMATGTSSQLEFYFASIPGFATSIDQTTLDDASVTLLYPPYNQIGMIATNNNIQLVFTGTPGTNYALDASFTLIPPQLDAAGHQHRRHEWILNFYQHSKHSDKYRLLANPLGAAIRREVGRQAASFSASE